MDTGVDINVIKLDTLDEDPLVDENEAKEITGITQSLISSIGRQIILNLKKYLLLFVIIKNGLNPILSPY